MNKYESQINKAKSMKVLQKVASHIGVKIGNIKDIVKAKNKLLKTLEKEQAEINREMEAFRKRLAKKSDERDFNRIRQAEKRFEKSFMNATPYEKEVFLGNKAAYYLDNAKIGSPLYYNNFKSLEEFEEFIKSINSENRSQYIKDYINSLDLNNYEKIKPRLTRSFNEKLNNLYDVGATTKKDAENELVLRKKFNDLDYIRQMEMMEIMDTQEYAQIVESLIRKGYSEPLALDIALKNLGFRSDDEYTLIQ